MSVCSILSEDSNAAIVLDNLMSLVDSTQAELFATQSKFMSACCSLAKKYNVVVLLVAHPNGTLTPDTKMDYYQISGNKDIPNLADVIIQVGKDHELLGFCEKGSKGEGLINRGLYYIPAAHLKKCECYV